MKQTSPELVATAGLMIIALAGAVVGLLVDATVITGAPVWLKPAKFAVSITIYTLTLAWIFTLIPEWRRTRRVVGWVTVVTMLIEIVIISAQAFRGTTSHFNVGTPADAALFRIMGLAIVVQTLVSAAAAVALWRQRFGDQALGWALRFGMWITIAGALTGGLMARPTSAQLEAARAGERLTIAGAHTVGAPDGGPGLAGTGWSTEHGDVRVPHFFGLHAIQVLPLVAFTLARLRPAERARTTLAIVAGTSYASLYVILLIQALRGVPLVDPDGPTLVQLVVWTIGTVVAGAVAWLNAAPAPRRTAIV